MARVVIVDEGGNEQTVRFAYPGQLIGGCAHGRAQTYCYSAEAVIGLLIADLANAYRRLHDLATATAHERLPQVLMEITDAHNRGGRGIQAREGPRPGSYCIVLPRQQLADMLGVTKETAVRP
jgi:CRP-like cAMP-binding protein